MEERKSEDNFDEGVFPQKKATDEACSCFTPKKPYGIHPLCKNCDFVVVGQTPSLEIGKMEDVYMCANDNGSKSIDSDFYAHRTMKFYDGCGRYKSKETGEDFDERYKFLSDLYFDRCRYILDNKDFYVQYCKKNDIDMYYFHKDFYWWKEIHEKHFKHSYAVYGHQKFELAKSLYYMMVDVIGE